MANNLPWNWIPNLGEPEYYPWEPHLNTKPKVKEMKKFMTTNAAGNSNGQFDTEEDAVNSAKQVSANQQGKPIYVYGLIGIAQNPVTAIEFTKVS